MLMRIEKVMVDASWKRTPAAIVYAPGLVSMSLLHNCPAGPPPVAWSTREIMSTAR
jgi:hypothetical protein